MGSFSMMVCTQTHTHTHQGKSVGIRLLYNFIALRYKQNVMCDFNSDLSLLHCDMKFSSFFPNIFIGFCRLNAN